MLLTHRVTLLCVCVLITACASGPPAYKRSLPELPKPAVMEEIGFVEGDAVMLSANATLIYAQSREQCDSKPVLVPEKEECAPRVVGRPHTCKTVEEHIDNELDCYRVAPAKDIAGALQVMVVDPTSHLGMGQGTAVANAKVTGQQAVKVPLNMQARPGECLILTDRAGTLIPVRDNHSERFRFSTAPMMHAQMLRDAEELVASTQTQLERTREDVRTRRAALVAHPAWRKGCVRPAMKPLPPEPPGLLTVEQIRVQAQGSCTQTLGRNVNMNPILGALLKRDKDQWLQSYATFQQVGRAECAQYKYDPKDITTLRFWDMCPFCPDQGFVELANAVAEACVRSVTSACGEGRLSYERQVASIKAEPETLYKACTALEERAQVGTLHLADAEAAVTQRKRELADLKKTSVDTRRMALSQAVCGDAAVTTSWR